MDGVECQNVDPLFRRLNFKYLQLIYYPILYKSTLKNDNDKKIVKIFIRLF